MAALGERVENGEGDIRKLEAAVDSIRESNSEIRKAMGRDQLAVLKEIGDLKVYIADAIGQLKGRAEATKEGRGDLKWLVGTVLGLAALAVSVYAALRP